MNALMPFWQWMIQQIQATNEGQFLRSQNLSLVGFIGYLVSFGIIVALFWLGLTLQWSFFIVSLLFIGLAAVSGFSQF